MKCEGRGVLFRGCINLNGLALDFQMARVRLLNAEDRPEAAELVERIRGGRRGNLINIYRLLLHSPSLAATWFEHLNSVRWGTELDGRLRELVIIRIAQINRCTYALRQHVPKLALADGVSVDECHAVADWHGSSFFDDREHAALAYAEAMTSEQGVSEEVFAPLRQFFNERQVVELTVLIGTYTMHNKVLEALRVDLEPSP
jgi:4-carboxymuconolactone decarboxylase